MSASVSTVKTAIRDAVLAAAIANLDCYAFMPTSLNLPCFVVGKVQISPSQTFGNTANSGTEWLTISCYVFASIADDADGQRLLDDLLSRDGARSVRHALWVARGLPGQAALGGAADDIAVTDIDGYDLVQYGGDSYYGATLTVRVLVS